MHNAIFHLSFLHLTVSDTCQLSRTSSMTRTITPSITSVAILAQATLDPRPLPPRKTASNRDRWVHAFLPDFRRRLHFRRPQSHPFLRSACLEPLVRDDYEPFTSNGCGNASPSPSNECGGIIFTTCLVILGSRECASTRPSRSICERGSYDPARFSSSSLHELHREC